MANQFSLSCQAHQLCDMAGEICNQFDKCGGAGQAQCAEQLNSTVATILAFMEGSDPAEKEEIAARLVGLINQITRSSVPVLALGNEYSFSDVNKRLDFVTHIIRTVEMVAGDDAFSVDRKQEIVEAAERLVNPALRLCVHLVNPDRHEFEWIDDYSVRLGSAAMSIAWRASAIVEDRGREIRRARAEGNIDR